MTDVQRPRIVVTGANGMLRRAAILKWTSIPKTGEWMWSEMPSSACPAKLLRPSASSSWRTARL